MRAARASESRWWGHSAAPTPPTGWPERRRSRADTPRPPRSTVQRASASSSGALASPKRWMPVRSPSARSIAWPSAMPQSSTVWCSSTCRSPVQLRSRSSRPWVARAVSMWSRKPTPVVTLERPVPSEADGHVDRRLPGAPGGRAAAAPDGIRAGGSSAGAGRPSSAARASTRRSFSAGVARHARIAPASSGSCPNVRTTRPRAASRAKASSESHGVWKVTKLPAPPISSSAQGGDGPGQAAALGGVGRGVGAHRGDVAAGELRAPRGARRQRPGRAQRVEGAGDGGAGQRVAAADGAEAPALGEGAGDHEVLAALDEAREVGAAELQVGLVDDHEARAGRAQRLDRLGGHLLAGGVVRRAEPHRAPRGAGQHGLQVEPQGGAGEGVDRLQPAPAVRVATAYSWYVGRAATASVAAPEGELGRQQDDLVGARAGHDLLRRKPA